MDKQGKTITIKINGKDRPMKEEKHMKKDEDESQYFKNDRNEALNEAAVSQESVDDNFDWILPDPIEEEVVKEYKIAPKQPKKQKKNIGISVWNPKNTKNNRLYSTIFITVFFAVLLGTAFGVTILKFVTADTEPNVSAISKVNTPSDKADTGTGTDTETGNSTAKLNNISAFVVQNGIFTTEDAAKERVNLLSGQGVSAEIFSVNGQYAIYLGTAGTIEDAKEISNTLKSKGVEVFAKPVEISGGTAANLTSKEAKLLEQSSGIYSILSSGKADTPETLKKVVDFQIMLSEIPDKSVKDKNILKAKASIERASQAFTDYQKSKDKNQLAQMQADLLSFLSSYQSIGK